MFQIATKTSQSKTAAQFAQPGMLSRLLNTRTQTMRRFSTRGQAPGAQPRCVASLAQRRFSKQSAQATQVRPQIMKHRLKDHQGKLIVIPTLEEAKSRLGVHRLSQPPTPELRPCL